MQGLRQRLTYANVIGTLALFVALSGGALAVTIAKKNSVTSKSVKNATLLAKDFKAGQLPAGAQGAKGETGAKGDTGPPGSSTGPAGGDLSGTYPNPTLAAGSVAGGAGGEVLDNSLAGADINESTLGQVPSALTASLGGFGRSSGTGAVCDPETLTFVTCTSVALDLPAATRVLLIAQVRGQVEGGAGSGFGNCLIGSSVGSVVPAAKTRVQLFTAGGADTVAMVGVTPLIGPGSISFGVDCNQDTGFAGAIEYADHTISAVAISPD